jgi:hypothetical protein
MRAVQTKRRTARHLSTLERTLSMLLKLMDSGKGPADSIIIISQVYASS